MNPRPVAWSYHRVSTRDQHPDAARAELVRAAEDRGLELVHAIEETGSGARNDRPGLRTVLEGARARRYAWLLVWKLDRIGRSMIDVCATIEELNACGVTIVFTSQGMEAGPKASPFQRYTLRNLASAAELERELIIERTHLGLAAARRRGSTLGRPRRWVDTGRVAELVACGLSLRAAAAEIGIPESTARRALACAKNVPVRTGLEPGALPRQTTLTKPAP